MAVFNWEELPLELRDKIIAHIGAPEVLALGLVCKHWNSLISCSRFLRFCAEIPHTDNEQWMLIPKWPFYDGYLAFRPGSNKWTNIPFGLRQNLHVESSMHGESRSFLLLGNPKYAFPHRFYIYSPLLRSSKIVIRCQSGVDPIRGTAVLIHDYRRSGVEHRDPANFRFRIVALSLVQQQARKEEVELASSPSVSALQAILYDSSTGSWSRGVHLPPGVQIKGAQNRQSVLVESKSEGILMLVLGERDETQELLVYQIHKQKWGQIQLPGASGVQTKNLVVHCEGAALEMFVLLLQLDPVGKILTLWRLPVEDLVSDGSASKRNWVCEMGAGREIDDRFVDDENMAVDCIGLRDRIIVCKFPNYMSYQFESKSWALLASPPEKVDCISRAFVFCPKLM